MTKDIWRYVTPQFDGYESQFQHYDTLQANDFFSCQPRAEQALKRFAQLQGLARVLIINAPDNSVYRNLIRDTLHHLDEEKSVIVSETTDKTALFTILKAQNGHVVSETPGLLDKADHGYLVMTPNWLLANPTSWPILKAAILGEPISGINCDPRSPIQYEWSRIYDVKLVIAGDREQLANLDFLDADIRSGLALFSEIELEMKITPDSINTYFGYLKWICVNYALPNLRPDAIKLLMTHGVRYTEDQHYAPLCLFWLRSLLEEAQVVSNHKTITAQHIQQVIDDRYQRESYLPERAASDIFDGQVLIETSGKQIGQVNGLTVIDVAGHPVSYGEPARISCVVHFGDGDINDVERKVELGGNLHAKGMMIMQAFVSAALELDSPLPYSASIVFEQSYSEVDGDSASVAEVCSLLSALSNLPINQEIAVTGAVDQFGRVQAVGGLNEKIEGFFRVCEYHGLTGHQGVVLPKTNLHNLALKPALIEQIKLGKFHIWPVSTVDEVIPIIMERNFRDDTNECVVNEIINRIENLEHHDNPLSFIEKLLKRFSNH